MTIRNLKYQLDKYKLTTGQIVNTASSFLNIILWKIGIKRIVSSAPLILMVEPTNICNFQCPLCENGSGKMTRPGGMMSKQSFTNILNDAGKGLKMLYLWNQGEPFLNREITGMIAEATHRNIFTIVSTNGSFLIRDAETLIDSAPDELIVSLDGVNEAAFNLYRRGGDFQEIIEGIKKLVKFRGKRLKPYIALQFLLLKHNIHQISDFKRLCENTGADRIYWKTVQVSSSEEAAKYLPRDNRYSRYDGYETLSLKRKRFDCRRILYSMVIDWNGNVVPCCFDKDELFAVGNAIEGNIKDIWRSPELQKFRLNISSGKRPPMCSNCTEGLEKMFLS